MGSAPPVERGFSPLDEELGLGAGHWTPQVEEWCVRLGTWMPFAQAAALLEDLTRVQISEASVRRKTEAAGAIWVQIQTEQVDQLEATLVEPPPGPAQLVLSGDGAMVPLRGGEWAEVKTVVVGEPKEASPERRLHRLSYFSRLTDAATFGRLALVELHGRGVESAGQVAAVTDGAEWLQGFMDLHRADAIRILDWVHAVERVQRIGEAVLGQQAQTWVESQKQRLWEVGPGPLLAEVHSWLEESPAIGEDVAYLEKRVAQMQDPQFRQQGWPVGSGSVESANKLLVQVRLKGAGMHWERSHVNPMLALRTIVCNDRWKANWILLAQRQRQNRVRRQESRPCLARPSHPMTKREEPSPACPLGARNARAPVPTSSERRPAADHPWRRRLLPAAQHAKS
jgi:hypothetical protein